ncbi:glycosyltransferase family 2 protein [Aliikangiella coralliicola]|uniref:Glycosyltransferase family 2 protein n=1 Tax=Aliikangiella coralliicola TaxID=2592383 RepID=A0A545TSM1_9GAMM|nr:glycosyltransferase family 2 protein [Aliikangiella coralliicola]TQV80217.1 glycosyltransferase family 2 protein [Aliikangiella coralliicola]
MKLSIVTTLYKSAPFVNEFYERITLEALKITDDYEIVFVNDGCPDGTLKKVITLYESDEKVKIIELSRNFGHHRAIMVGLDFCVGEYVFLIDSDLEESPEWLSCFHARAVEEQADVIIGVQSTREGTLTKRVGGNLFYKIFNTLSSIEVPEGATTARLMNRPFINSLKKFKERELFFAGLCEMTGFNQLTVEVTKSYKGHTSYSFIKRLKQSVDAITSFSNRPLYLIFVVGCLVFLFSSLYIAWIFYQKLFLSLQLGYASLIASIWAVGGLTLMCTGILGIYLGKIFSEVKSRPTIIKRIFERTGRSND